MSIIETKNLTKYYGKAKGIEDVSLSVHEGEILGWRFQLPSATRGRFKRQAAVASVLLKRLSKGALWDVTRSLPRNKDIRFVDL